MNRGARRRWIALGLAAVAVVAWLAWRTQAPPGADAAAPVAEPSPERTTTAGPVRAESAPRPIDPLSARRALPAPGSLDELAARAGGGDAIAACQLAAELSDCRLNETLRASGSRDPLHASTPRCEALLAKYRGRHFDWLRQAAHAGEPEAMLRYASGEAFGVPGDSFDYLRSPHFDTWRREAPAMLEALLEAGYPEAVVVRMLASQAMLGGPLYSVLEPDRLQDLAYASLAMRLQRGMPNLPAAAVGGSRVDPLLRQQATELAARWHQERFEGRTYDLEASYRDGGFPLMRARGLNCSAAVDGSAP